MKINKQFCYVTIQGNKRHVTITNFAGVVTEIIVIIVATFWRPF